MSNEPDWRRYELYGEETASGTMLLYAATAYLAKKASSDAGNVKFVQL